MLMSIDNDSHQKCDQSSLWPNAAGQKSIK